MKENERLYFIIHITLHVDQSDCLIQVLEVGISFDLWMQDL